MDCDCPECKETWRQWLESDPGLISIALVLIIGVAVLVSWAVWFKPK